jgi:hypothetical protein
MPPIRLAITAVTLAISVARHPLVRAGLRTIADNPKARDAAINATRNAAYNAGVIVRRVVPRGRKPE